MTEDVTVENEIEDQTVETTETEVDEVETDSQEDDALDNQEAEGEEVEETAEERLERIQKELEAKERKIARQTAANRKVQEILEQRNRELETIQSRLQALEKPQQAEPKQDDFDTYAEYDEARIKYLADVMLKEREKELLTQQHIIAEQKLIAERGATLAKQEQEYVKVNPNYKHSREEVESFVNTFAVAPDVMKFIQDQLHEGNVAQVIDYFGSNGGERLGELEEIFNMSPRKAAIAIYEIQKGFKAPEKKETKPLTKPVTKIKATAKKTRAVDDLSQEEFRKWLAN